MFKNKKFCVLEKKIRLLIYLIRVGAGVKMSCGGGSGIINGGGLEALLEAAKYVEQQELQKKKNLVVFRGKL